MAQRQELLESIASTISDYRASDLEKPTEEHVDRWVKQFDSDVQVAILREMDHVLGETYFSFEEVTKFLDTFFNAEKLVGKDPCAFFKSVRFLDIQRGGNSQREMLSLFNEVLEEHCGFGIQDCGEGSEEFIYLDDGIFTGNRVRRDLETWIKTDAPKQAKLHVVTIALHRGGQYYAGGRIKSEAKEAGKTIDIQWWRALGLEDRRAFTNTSDVLRPTEIPDVPEVKEYVEAMRYPPHLRTGSSVGEHSLFSSEKGRSLLEQEFLKAGVRIRKLCPNLGDTQRPLGHMTLVTLGFGSLIVTFRNCPNNAPLALWADDPWYPLFPRTTNSETEIKRLFETLEKGKA